jgi:hypothetical protein
MFKAFEVFDTPALEIEWMVVELTHSRVSITMKGVDRKTEALVT